MNGNLEGGLIRVFNGQWRGSGGEGGKAYFAQMSFRFREYLHLFRGPNLHVFLSIALHMDEDGLAFPSYDTIQAETGYKRATIAKAIDELCETKLDGMPVLLRWRKRDKRGRFIGSNQYKVFPTQEEIEQMNVHSSLYPTVDKVNSKENQKLKENQVNPPYCS